MTNFQLWTLFGTPVVGAILAWGLVGLHRLLPRPSMQVKTSMEERRLAGALPER